MSKDFDLGLGAKGQKGLFPWTASGRAIANGRDEGVTKLLFDNSPEAHGHGKILGGGMVGTDAGDMIGEIALAIEMGADAVDIGQNHSPAPHAGGKHWHGGGSGAWVLYRPAAGAQIDQASKLPCKSRALAGSGFLLSVCSA